MDAEKSKGLEALLGKLSKHFEKLGPPKGSENAKPDPKTDDTK